MVELVKDETTPKLDTEKGVVSVTRVMVEDYGIDEYLNTCMKIAITIDDAKAAQTEREKMLAKLDVIKEEVEAYAQDQAAKAKEEKSRVDSFPRPGKDSKG